MNEKYLRASKSKPPVSTYYIQRLRCWFTSYLMYEKFKILQTPHY